MSPTPLFWLFFIALMTIAGLFFSLFQGSAHIAYDQVVNELLGLKSANPNIHLIIYQIRLPRALSAFVTGALLALSGALMQVLLRNPLADPYILGMSGGAALSVLLCLLLGGTVGMLPMGAWAGSLLAVLLLFLLSHRRSLWQSEYLLLNGIILASSFSAIISFILFIAPNETLHSMLFWLLGDLSAAPMPYYESILLFLGLLFSLYLAPRFNILLRGTEVAESLGVNLLRLQIQIYLLCAMMTGAAVALAGCIGFVGLIVPHLFRLMIGQDYRFLLPGSALLGGSFLLIADTLARTLFTPIQLPVGLMTALLGLPIFIFLLQKRSQCPIQ